MSIQAHIANIKSPVFNIIVMIAIIAMGILKQHLIHPSIIMNIVNVLVKALVKVLYGKYKTRGVVENFIIKQEA